MLIYMWCFNACHSLLYFIHYTHTTASIFVGGCWCWWVSATIGCGWFVQIYGNNVLARRLYRFVCVQLLWHCLLKFYGYTLQVGYLHLLWWIYGNKMYALNIRILWKGAVCVNANCIQDISLFPILGTYRISIETWIYIYKTNIFVFPRLLLIVILINHWSRNEKI